MRAGGKITKLTAKEDLSTLMEMSTTDNGSMIRPMDLVYIAILMELSTKDTGRKISNTEMDSKHGQMVLNTKVNTFKARSTELADLLGLMEALIMESLSRIIFKAKENIIGPMEENMTDLG